MAVLLVKNHCVRIHVEIGDAISRILYSVECFVILLVSFRFSVLSASH